MTVDKYMRLWKEARTTPDPLIEAWKEFILVTKRREDDV